MRFPWRTYGAWHAVKAALRGPAALLRYLLRRALRGWVTRNV